MWSWRHEVSGTAHQNRLSICFKWNWKRIHSIIEEGAQASRLSTDINNWFCLNSGHPPIFAKTANTSSRLECQHPQNIILPTSAPIPSNFTELRQKRSTWNAPIDQMGSSSATSPPMDIWVCLALALGPWTFVGREFLGCWT